MSEQTFVEKFLKEVLPATFITSADRLEGALDTLVIAEMNIGEADSLIEGISKFLLEDAPLPDGEETESFAGFIERFKIIRDALKKLR